MSTRALLVDIDGTLYHQDRVRLGMMWLLARAYLFRPFEGRRVMRALSAYRHAQESLRATPSDPAIPLDQRQLRHAAADLRPHPRLSTAAHRSVDAQRAAGSTEEGATCRRHRNLRGTKNPRLEDRRSLRLPGVPASSKLWNSAVDEIVCAQDPDVQHFKPSPAGIEAALHRLHVDPADAIYIGDREDVDAAAARAAHVCSLILKPRERFPTAATIDATLELGCSPDG